MLDPGLESQIRFLLRDHLSNQRGQPCFGRSDGAIINGHEAQGYAGGQEPAWSCRESLATGPETSQHPRDLQPSPRCCFPALAGSCKFLLDADLTSSQQMCGAP